MGRGTGMGRNIPEPLRIWELTRMGLAAWVVAGAVGYVLCECRACRVAQPTRRAMFSPTVGIPADFSSIDDAVVCMRYADIRPKWYPKIEYEKARPFTPKEVEEWNQASGKKR